MDFNYDKYYEKYWEQDDIKREMNYYDQRYNHLKNFLKLPIKTDILDVGGGNGQFLKWLNVKNGTVLDISQSGLLEARKYGYHTIKANVQKKFPIPSNSYNYIISFETVEHLDRPDIMLNQINRCLKPDGLLILGVPNMPADGIHHKKRWYIEDVKKLVNDTGFHIESINFTPGFLERESLNKIFRIKSPKKIAFHLAAYLLSCLPFRIKFELAHKIPNRFAMIFIIKCKKAGSST